MTKTKKKTISILLAVLFLATAIYFEVYGLEIHRLAVGIIGISEVVLFIQVLTAFNKNAADKNWTTSKSIKLKTFLSIGLILFMVTIDRLIYYTLTYYNKDYKIFWTIIIPGSIVVTEFFKILDIWSYNNEKKDKNSGI